MKGWLLVAMIVLSMFLHTRLRGVLGRSVLWTTLALVGSMMYRGGRVMVLPFLFVLIIEGLYWLALPRAEQDGSQG